MKLFELFEPQVDANMNDEEMIRFINTNCSRVLSEFRKTGLRLYRGGDMYSPDFVVSQNYEQRRGSMTAPGVQKKIDKCLTMCGFKALRHNSVFCTPNFDHAALFAVSHHVLVILPFNNFDFIWSPVIKDLGAFSAFGEDAPALQALRDGPGNSDFKNLCELLLT